MTNMKALFEICFQTQNSGMHESVYVYSNKISTFS